MSLQCEVLPDRSEARQERLRAFRDPEASHTALAFTRGLMTIFGAIVYSGTGFDEDVFHVCQFRYLGFRGRIAAKLIGHDLARPFGTSGEHTLEKSLGCCLVATLLQQDIEFGTVLINRSPQQIRLAAQRNKHFVEVLGRARLATRSLNAMREARAEFVAPAPDRFVTDDHPALKQQLFDVARAQLKPEIPAHRATDNDRRKAVTAIKRFCILHRAILPDRPGNVTEASKGRARRR